MELFIKVSVSECVCERKREYLNSKESTLIVRCAIGVRFFVEVSVSE